MRRFVMIIFFTFDATIFFGIIALIIAIFANGVTEVATMISNQYLPIMRTVFILSIVISFVVGFIETQRIFDNEKSKLKKCTSSISSALYNCMFAPPVVLLTVHGVLLFISDWLADGFSLALLVFFGLLILLIFVIIISLILAIGFGIPLLVKYFLFIDIDSDDNIWKSFLMLIIGAAISAVYYLILRKEPTYPFISTLR